MNADHVVALGIVAVGVLFVLAGLADAWWRSRRG